MDTIRTRAVIRPLEASDPRSLDHPGQREKWRKLAYSLGEALAQLEWDRRQGERGHETDSRQQTNTEGEDRGDLRPVLE